MLLHSLFSLSLFYRTISTYILESSSSITGEGNGTPLQYSCLENSMDGGAWKAAVHGVAEGRTRLSDFTFTFHFHALEKEMATHSSVVAGRIPGTGEPGGLLSMGLHRVGHDWSDLAASITSSMKLSLTFSSAPRASCAYFWHSKHPRTIHWVLGYSWLCATTTTINFRPYCSP